MPADKPHVFNIPASAPFLPVLIDALLAGRLVQGFPATRDPLELARATLYLPTRRAARLAREVFLDRVKGDAAILPRIGAIGDIDEDEFAFADAATAGLSEAALDLPETIAPLERRLLLAALILQWANSPELRGIEGSPLIANTPSAALGLADDLARLIDDMTTRQVGWDKLDRLVPDELDPYWQLSLRFLKIAREAWPQIRAERGAIESADRRDRLIEAEAARLANTDAPVIAAGSTGSMPATAKLLATIARLPHGALVLPGLDTDLDDASWQAIAGGKGTEETPAASHPQFAMHGLLARIGIVRGDVCVLGAPQAHGRERLVSEALRPAITTDRWQARTATEEFAAATDKAINSISIIDAANAEEEALAIAIALREALETEGKTAALVTPDRALARRVLAALERWRVPVDDSGGDRLADTSAGIFARLAAEAALGGLAPVTLLALLKHPLLRLGAGKHGNAGPIATIEHALLRGPRPRAGSEGLDRALANFRLNRDRLHHSDSRWLIEDDAYDVAAEFITALGAALAPLEGMKRAHSLAQFAAAHRAVIAALSTDAEGKLAAFAGNDGTALARALDELAESPSAASLIVGRGDYAELFHAAIAVRVVRRPELHNVRVRIFGPLEARLQSVDRIVLGGLNEGTWPGETQNDPWLSRPMRATLGLDPPERRIGLAAHDFAQAFAAQEVILSRAGKVGGAPTVTSRFVQRLAAVAGKRWDLAVQRGEDILKLARKLDHPETVKPVSRPEPKPPVETRPSRLSVTAIEDWLRDPYTIYARSILRLRPLDPVDTAPGARDRGTLIHSAVGDYTELFAKSPPAEPLKELLKLGEKYFAPLADYTEARAFWWPRFERIARWFIGWDAERRAGIAALHAEIRGEIAFPVGARQFILSTIADRIEQRNDGGYAILDYKTGAARTEKQVRTGLAPQLTLEAAILRHGKFGALANGSVTELAYVTLKGGSPAGRPIPVTFKEGTPDSQADNALTRLKALAARFEDKDTPYRSLVSPMWATRYGDYDHLARVKEWSATGGENEDVE